MENQEQQRKIALLIDAENTSYKNISAIIQDVSIYGHIITKKAYANWQSISKEWVEVIKDNAIEPIQQFNNASKKNSSDIALVIDAMDLLYTKKFDTFVIVASDSDYTKLITRLKNDEIYVLGYGEEKSSKALIKAYDDFKYIENLIPEVDQKKSKESKTVSTKREMMDSEKTALVSILSKIADTYSKDEEGWVNIGSTGSVLKRVDPSFAPQNYGYSSLVKLIENELTDFIEIVTRNNSQGRPVITEYRIK